MSGPGRIELGEKPIPEIGRHDAPLRVTTLKPLVTHRFKLDDIEKAYDLFASKTNGVIKVTITV